MLARQKTIEKPVARVVEVVAADYDTIEVKNYEDAERVISYVIKQHVIKQLD